MRGLDHQLEGVDAEPAGEIGGRRGAGGGVGVEPGDEHAVHRDAVVVEGADGLLDRSDALVLADLRQPLVGDRLDADHHHLAARLAHEGEELMVDLRARERAQGGIGADLRGPERREAGGAHRTKELGRAGLVDDEVVVVEEDPLGAEALELGEDLVRAPVADGPGEHRDHRAELAVEGTAPLGHERLRGHPAMALDEAQVGDRQPLELLLGAAWPGGVVVGLPVASPEGEPPHLLERPSLLEAGDELADRLLALAPHDVAGVAERLVGTEAHVRAAEDDRHPGGAEEVGETVGGRRGGSRRGDPDEVGAEKVVEVDGCEHLAVDADVVARLGKHVGHERETETGQEGTVVDVVAGRTGLDEANAQTHRPLSPHLAGWLAKGTSLA